MEARLAVLASLRSKLETLYQVILRHGDCQEVYAYGSAMMDVNQLIGGAGDCRQQIVERELLESRFTSCRSHAVLHVPMLAPTS